MSAIDQFDQALAGLGMVDPAERRRAHSLLTPRSFDRESYLHRAGEVATEVYFLCTGLARFYYLTPDGRELNKSFSREGQFAGGIQYTDRPGPSRFFIQALEPVEALAISLAGLGRLYLESLAWANLGRLYMEDLAVRKSDREAAFLLDSAEVRYRAFLEREPELSARLPLYHVASYLGITDVALSRIRRRLKESTI